MGPGALLQAEALHEVARAAHQLARPGEERHDGVHQARKSIRRVRAVLALGGEGFSDSRAVRRLDADLRTLCRGLSSLRDADALRDALLHLARDAIIDPIDCERLCAVVDGLRHTRLTAALARDPDFARRRARLHQAHSRLQSLPWSRITDAAVQAARARSRQRLRKAFKHARRSDDPALWHTLRRRLRRLRQQESALARRATEVAAPSAGVAELAERMSKVQDHALLLARCRRSGIFPARDRSSLRRVVEPLYRAARAHIGEGAGLAVGH